MEQFHRNLCPVPVYVDGHWLRCALPPRHRERCVADVTQVHDCRASECPGTAEHIRVARYALGA